MIRSDKATGLRARRLAGILVVLIAAFAQPAIAGRLGRGPQIELLRLEGRLGPPRPEDRGTENLSLQDGRNELRFQLTDLRVLSGGRLAGSVLSSVRPRRPNFFLRGSKEALEGIRAAKTNDMLRIMGYHRRGSRDLMVTEVETLPPPTATAVSKER
jgi:hypothetical protein